jgi:hypothetical protein
MLRDTGQVVRAETILVAPASSRVVPIATSQVEHERSRVSCLREEVVRDEAEVHASMHLDASLDGIAQVEHDEGKRRASRACVRRSRATGPRLTRACVSTRASMGSRKSSTTRGSVARLAHA